MSTPAGYTQIIAANIKDAFGNPLTGSFHVLPTDGNDEPITATASGGGPIVWENVPPATITAGALPATCWVPDTSLTKPANISYRFTIEDAAGVPVYVLTGVQPTGPSLNLDTYTPNVAPQAVIQYGPEGNAGLSAYGSYLASGGTLSQGAWVAALGDNPPLTGLTNAALSLLAPSRATTTAGVVTSTTTTPVSANYAYSLPLPFGAAGGLLSVSAYIATLPAGGTLDILILKYPDTGNTTDVLDRFTVTPAGTGLQTFYAGKDFAPRSVPAGAYGGCWSASTAIGYDTAASGVGTGFGYFSGNPAGSGNVFSSSSFQVIGLSFSVLTLGALSLGATATQSGSPLIATASSLGADVRCNLDTGKHSDGSAATDATAILNAFLATASVATAAPVHLIVDGGCLIHGLTTPQAGVSIAGLGWNTGFFMASGANSHAITNGYPPTGYPPAVANPSVNPAPAGTRYGFSLANLRLNGNRAQYTTTDGAGNYYFGLALMGVKGVRLRDVWFYDIPTYAVAIGNCADIVVEGCRVDSPSNAGNTDGLHFYGNTSDVRVANCYFNDGDDAIALNAPENYPGAVTRVTVTNCVFNGCTTAMRCYTTYTAGSTYPVSQVVFANCVISITPDASGYLNCAWLLGFGANGSAVDGLQDFTASNCTVICPGSPVLLGDSAGSVVLDNVTWMSPNAAIGLVGYVAACTVSYLGINNCRVYRTPAGNAAACLIANTLAGSANSGDACTIAKLRINGFEILDQAGQSYGTVGWLMDLLNLSIGELVIDALSPNHITALFRPAIGSTSVGTIRGNGLLAMGYQLTASQVAANQCFVDTNGNTVVNGHTLAATTAPPTSLQFVDGANLWNFAINGGTESCVPGVSTAGLAPIGSLQLVDTSDGSLWDFVVSGGTADVTPGPPLAGVAPLSAITLTDTAGATIWKITAANGTYSISPA